MRLHLSETVGYILIVLSLCLFALQGIVFIRANAQTFDEAYHYAAGYSYLSRGNFGVMYELPPLPKQIIALPLYLLSRFGVIDPPSLPEGAQGFGLGAAFLYTHSLSPDTLLTLGRLPNLLLGIALIALIGLWLYRLWGSGAALLGMSLAALDPNLVSHASLATVDMATTHFAFLTLYLLWEYLRSPSIPYLLAVGIAMGLALASKFSMVILLPVVFLILVWKRRWRGIPLFLMVMGIAFLILLPIYGFSGWSTWFLGLQNQLLHVRRGHAAFLLGMHSMTGWWYYFPIAFLIKTPLPVLILLSIALLFPRRGIPIEKNDVLFLILPSALILILMMVGNIDIGLRYILPLYPFLYVLLSRVATFKTRRPLLMPALLCTAFILTGISTLRIAPHSLAYFNELVGGPGQGYKYLSDSNIDWGQDLKTLKRYMDDHDLPAVHLSYFGSARPSTYGITYVPLPMPFTLETPTTFPTEVPPVYAISVTNLQGTYLKDKETFKEFRDRTPIAKLGYSIYIYDLRESK